MKKHNILRESIQTAAKAVKHNIAVRHVGDAYADYAKLAALHRDAVWGNKNGLWEKTVCYESTRTMIPLLDDTIDLYMAG